MFTVQCKKLKKGIWRKRLQRQKYVFKINQEEKKWEKKERKFIPLYKNVVD